MALSDYVGAGPGAFNLLANVPRSGQSVSIWAPSSTVKGQTPTEAGMRLTLGSSTYTVTNTVTPSDAVSGQQQWVGVRISPYARAALTTAASVTFEPYAIDSGRVPTSISVRRGESVAVDLRGWFKLVGTSFAAGRFTVTASGGAARLAVSGHTLTVVGVTAGTGETATVTFHSGALSVSVHTRINVELSNRAPTSTRALGDVRVVPGQDPSWNLSDHFEDPDGDPLTYTATSSNPAVATVLPIDSPSTKAPAGERLTLDVSAIGSATVFVTASDDRGLTVGQQVHVAVTAGQPPIATKTLSPVGLEFEGQSVRVDLADFFDDPDGPEPEFYCEYWEPATATGTAGSPWEALRWRVTGIRAGPRLVVRSRKIGSQSAPWGSGAPWILPMQSSIYYRGTWAGVRQTLTLTNTFDVAMSFNSLEQAVEAVLLVDQVLPSVGSTTQTQVTLGGTDSVWPVFDATDPSTLILEPGSVGSRTLWIGAYDASGQRATQLLVASTSRAPTYAAISDIVVTAGTDAAPINLAAHFRDPEFEQLTFSASTTDNRVARAIVDGQTLHVHGVAAGNASVSVTATDPAGVSATGTFFVGVGFPQPVVPPSYGTREAPHLVRDIFRSEGFEMIAYRTVVTPSPYTTGGQWRFATFPDPGGGGVMFAAGATRLTLASKSIYNDFDLSARLSPGLTFSIAADRYRITSVEPPLLDKFDLNVVQSFTVDPPLVADIVGDSSDTLDLQRDPPFPAIQRWRVGDFPSSRPGVGFGPYWRPETATTVSRVAAARPVQPVRDFTDLSQYFNETRLYVATPVPDDFDTLVELQFTNPQGVGIGNRWAILQISAREHARSVLFYEVLVRELSPVQP